MIIMVVKKIMVVWLLMILYDDSGEDGNNDVDDYNEDNDNISNTDILFF